MLLIESLRNSFLTALSDRGPIRCDGWSTKTYALLAPCTPLAYESLSLFCTGLYRLFLSVGRYPLPILLLKVLGRYIIQLGRHGIRLWIRYWVVLVEVQGRLC